jgi:hypothetical protein
MRKLLLVLVLGLLFLAGCYPGAPITCTGPSQQASIISFNTEPSSISAGESSELSWNVSGATTVSIDQGIGNVALTGKRVVAPAATTTYTLTAISTAGSVTATTQVIVTATAPPTPTSPPVINSFIASPNNISYGGSTSLSWSVSNATSVTIDNGVGAVGTSGSTTVLPTTTTTYTLTASNAAGSDTEIALVTVSGVPSPVGLPVINFFTATPQVISGGSGSTFLRWNVSNATSVSIDNGVGSVDTHGTMLLTLSYSTNLTLTAYNSYGMVYQTLPITVSGVPLPPTFAVTSVIASSSPPSYSGPCPYQFNFYATITVNGAGTVTYQWERSDGTSDLPQTISFSSAGSQTVTTYWYLGAIGSGWERVHILSPNSTVSNQAFFMLNCL